MAKVLFEIGNSGSGSLPFLDAYIEKHPSCDGSDHPVIAVKETRKRSGYMLVTADFQCLIWKSSEWADILIEFLNRMQVTNPGYLLGIQIDEESIDGFVLFSDPAVPRMWLPLKKRGGLLHLDCVIKENTKKKSL